MSFPTALRVALAAAASTGPFAAAVHARHVQRMVPVADIVRVVPPAAQ